MIYLPLLVAASLWVLLPYCSPRMGISQSKYGYANAVGVVMFIIGLIVLGVVNKLFRMDEANY